MAGRGSGEVVSVLSFYSEYPSFNPAEVYSFIMYCCVKRIEINTKRGREMPIKKFWFAMLKSILVLLNQEIV